MKVELTKHGLMIVPETDFEEQYLGIYRNRRRQDLKVFLKRGMTPKDIVGLRIDIIPPENEANEATWQKK